MTEPSIEFASTPDGLTQLRRRWAVPQARAAVLLVHGIGEHTGRYGHVGSWLAAAGLDVLAADNRGFGQSGGRRAYVRHFDEFLDDLVPLLEDRRSLGVPVVLIGHSLGGLIVSAYLVSGRPRPDLAILSAPALAAIVPTWQRLLAPAMAQLLPKVFVRSTIDATLLSRDPAVQAAYLADPLVVAGATGGLAQAVFETMRSTNATLDRITLPTYVVHGSDDGLVPPSASEPLERLPSVERRLWAGLRHECFNEPEKVDVLAEMLGWIDHQLVGVSRAGSST
jgi:alpha-beta hydrolase superfamily lysophospholipase